MGSELKLNSRVSLVKGLAMALEVNSPTSAETNATRASRNATGHDTDQVSTLEAVVECTGVWNLCDKFLK